MIKCRQCGKCCINNGLIPPAMPDEDLSGWLLCLVNRLRTEFGATAENYPCVFLTDDMRCSIHEMARPGVCQDFVCESRMPQPEEVT